MQFHEICVKTADFVKLWWVMDDVVHCKVNKLANLLTKLYFVTPVVGKT